MPYEARANTGKGIPYFVPGCEFRRIGINTMVFPSKMVKSASVQLIPAVMRPDAIMYVGMQCAIEIQRAAKLYVVHFRSARRVGARSSL
jgi:hypothetical protein